MVHIRYKYFSIFFQARRVSFSHKRSHQVSCQIIRRQNCSGVLKTCTFCTLFSEYRQYLHVAAKKMLSLSTSFIDCQLNEKVLFFTLCCTMVFVGSKFKNQSVATPLSFLTKHSKQRLMINQKTYF